MSDYTGTKASVHVSSQLEAKVGSRLYVHHSFMIADAASWKTPLGIAVVCNVAS